MVSGYRVGTWISVRALQEMMHNDSTQTQHLASFISHLPGIPSPTVGGPTTAPKPQYLPTKL